MRFSFPSSPTDGSRLLRCRSLTLIVVLENAPHPLSPNTRPPRLKYSHERGRKACTAKGKFVPLQTIKQSIMFSPFTLNIRSKIVSVTRPLVMAIFNTTPDSFYSRSRLGGSTDDYASILEKMVADGADIIDIGGYSSRPGAADISEEEEWQRVQPAISLARRILPDTMISVDTFRSGIARRAADEGADIINDISAGALDPAMADVVAAYRLPYIIMHMRGTPETMGTMTDYPRGVVAEVIESLSETVRNLRLKGVADIIADPGFGFAKTLEQNYELLAGLKTVIDTLGLPTLVGMSRKSMLSKLLDIPTEETLPATVTVNTQALLQGAAIVRVHDVREGVQAVKLAQALSSHMN